MALGLMEGNEAVAWGAIEAGCRFFAGYPMTPATSILNSMVSILPSRGGICIQGEDEIASIGYCLGASMAGLKAMTATSGPGMSLISEQISFAIGSEIPIVIVDVQRLGPSTGSATRGADGDIQFLRWNSSGGLPVIVLCPTNVKDCYLLTIHAFNLSEKYRCPVLIASNKEIGMTRESIDLNSIEKPAIFERRTPPIHQTSFQPFEVPESEWTPYFLPIGGKTIVRQTSSTHGPDGYITTDTAVISNNQMRLKKKIESNVDQFSFYEFYSEGNSETIIITYGVTARAAKAIYNSEKSSKSPVALLILKTLWPVPEQVIKEKTKNINRVIVVEMNIGQYLYEIQRILPDKPIDFLGRMDGSFITPHQIYQMIHHE